MKIFWRIMCYIYIAHFWVLKALYIEGGGVSSITTSVQHPLNVGNWTVFHNITVFCILYQINRALMSRRYSIKTHTKSYWSQTFEQLCMTETIVFLIISRFWNKQTCSNAYDEVSSWCWPLTLQPGGLQTMETIEVDEIWATEAADHWKPASIWS